MDWAWGIAGLILGAIAGSFLATAAIRWPAARRASAGRSHCDACGVTLNAVDLIPVGGFLIRRGRCRACGANIDRRHLAVELAAAGIGALSFALAPGLTGAAGALFGWMLLLLAVLDVEHFWLSDRVTIPLALLGIAFGSAGVMPYPNDRLLGLVVGFASLWLVGFGYRKLRGREGLGGGDPKLFGAIGAWLGWANLPFVLLLAAVIGLGAVAAARLKGEKVKATTRLPFGALLAVAAWPLWLLLFTRPG